MTSFALDDYRCRYLNVGSFETTADTLFGDAPPDALGRALEQYELGAGRVVAAGDGWRWQPEDLD